MTDSGLIFQKDVETYWAMLGKGWWGMGCAAAHCEGMSACGVCSASEALFEGGKELAGFGEGVDELHFVVEVVVEA